MKILYSLKNLIEHANTTQVEIDGKWYPARSAVEYDPLILRFRDAWKVLTKKADAFTWPGGQ